MGFEKILEFISPLLALTSVLIGIYSVRRGIKLLKKIELQSDKINTQTSNLDSIATNLISQSKELNDISTSLSTKFIGMFPKQLSDIIEEIKLTTESLVIVTDFPAYGCISNPERFAEYVNTISHLLYVKKVNVTLICYDEDKQLEYLKLQLNVKNTSNLIREKSILDKVKHFSSEFNIPTINTYNDLFKQLLRKNSEIFKLFEEKGMEVYQTKLDISMFYWLIDDNKRAIFSLYIHDKISKELSFRTEDQKVLEYLEESAKAVINNDRTSKKFKYGR